VALGQVFSENFGFPCQSTFHLLLHNHLHYHPRLAQSARSGRSANSLTIQNKKKTDDDAPSLLWWMHDTRPSMKYAKTASFQITCHNPIRDSRIFIVFTNNRRWTNPYPPQSNRTSQSSGPAFYSRAICTKCTLDERPSTFIMRQPRLLVREDIT
jgi:hypothetical protein